MNKHGIQGGQGRSDDDVEATAFGAWALLAILVFLWATITVVCATVVCATVVCS